MTFLIVGAYALVTYSNAYKMTIATEGGTFVEGIVGTPRFVNPVLAITRTDQDIVALIYSGLMRLSEEGVPEPDLAESVTISDDGLIYNVVLRENAYFHDGTKVTTADIAYTIGLIQDPALKSPLRGNWTDVAVEVINEREINIVLEEPYTPFIENLTVGILPKHIWGDLSIEQLPFSQHNTEPIGSGPYQFEKVARNNSGLIESYTFAAASQDNQTAMISRILLRFYQNEASLLAAFSENAIDATVYLSYDALPGIQGDEYHIITGPLPRVFSIFINPNRSPALRDSAAREALSAALNREELVAAVLHGYGFPTASPIPPGFLALESEDASSTLGTTASSGVRYAESVLIDGGWKQLDDGSWQKTIDGSATKLGVTLATANSELFDETASLVKQTWDELGVDVTIALYEQSDLVQANIRPRDYETLLFGMELGRMLDFYPFWHSSQKDDPGLNVALYTSITADRLLETARTTRDETARIDAIRAFEAEIAKEHPAIFLFTPAYTYVVRQGVETVPMERVLRPSERFSTIAQWHMEKDNVWEIFTY